MAMTYCQEHVAVDIFPAFWLWAFRLRTTCLHWPLMQKKVHVTVIITQLRQATQPWDIRRGSRGMKKEGNIENSQ
jgi:hypothetical protein